MAEPWEDLKQHITKQSDERFISEYLLRITDYNEDLQKHINLEVQRRNLSIVEVEDQRKAKAIRDDRDRKAKITGIGGWLVFYIISSFLTVFLNGSQILISGIDKYLSDPPGVLLVVILVLFCITITSTLIKNRYTKILAILTSGFFIFSGFVSLFVNISDLSGVDFFNITRNVVINGIWIAYFLTSERVQLTFRKPEQKHLIDMSA